MRWTPKKNLLWLLRNLSTLYLMSAQVFLGGWYSLLKLQNSHSFQVAFRYAFRRSFLVKISDGLAFINYPVTPSSTSTLKYWVLRGALSFFESPLRVQTSETRPHSYLHYCTNPALLTRSTKGNLRASTFKLLVTVLQGWMQWNKGHRITQQHVPLRADYFILKFLNLYYFKIFNL